MSDTAATEPDVQESAEPVEEGAAPDASADESPEELDQAIEGTPEEDDNGEALALSDEAVEDADESSISAVSVVEAILFASDAPLPAPKIARVVGTGGARDVRKHIEALNARYVEQGAAYRVDEVAGGFRMLTLPDFHPWLSKLRQTRAMTKLSKAALETLAIVAYKQPCLRADIEAVRGVAAGEVLNRLREMGLVKIVGRAEEVGRPMLYGTTRKFLEVFGLQRIEELPAVEGLQPPA